MVEIRMDRQGDLIQLHVSGSLVYSTVDQLREELLKVIPEQGTVRLVLQDIQEFDLPGVQLLYSLCRTGDTDGITVQINAGDAGPRIEKMLRFAGLAPIDCMQI